MSTAYLFAAGLPDHCTPTTELLTRLSTHIGLCVPTPLAATSSLLGCLSIVSWLGAQMPQIFKNYQIKSTAGLSLFFLAEWLLGDVTNLTGALLTHQAGWQVVVASYYVFVDLALVLQYFWYSYLRTKFADGSIHSADSVTGDDESDMINSLSPINTSFGHLDDAVYKDDTEDRPQSSTSKPINTPQFTAVNYEKNRTEVDASDFRAASWLARPSPRTTMLMTAAATMVSQVTATPVLLPLHATAALMMGRPHPTTAEYVGTIISWCSTFLYLGSRLPQIYKNWRRQSTAGLSPLLFFAAFCGNFFYTSSMVTNPNAWQDAGPYGNHGWVGPGGSKRGPWIANAAPFFLGAFGCLGLDVTIGIQFLLYGEGQDKLVRVRDRYGHSHWERVSGWMRGWIPTLAREKVVNLAESQRLLAESREIEQRSHHAGYGGI